MTSPEEKLANHPPDGRDAVSVRTIIECTEERPWDGTRNPNARVRHHGAGEVGEQRDGWPGGDIVRMRCRFCGHEWTMELPQ